MRAMELGLGERSPAKGKSPVAGKVNHDLGMFVGTKGEDKAANTDLFVSGMTCGQVYVEHHHERQVNILIIFSNFYGVFFTRNLMDHPDWIHQGDESGDVHETRHYAARNRLPSMKPRSANSGRGRPDFRFWYHRNVSSAMPME